MSILDVSNVSHGFGSRKILEDASFRLLKGEHIGLVGANGEGKTTFLNIITGKLLPDEGKITWCNHITTGYLDQYSTLEKGKTIRDILRSAFAHMYDLEKEMIVAYDKMTDCTPEEMEVLIEDAGEIQSILESGDFYSLDSKIEEYASGLGLVDIGLDRDVSELSGGQRQRISIARAFLKDAPIILMDEATASLDVDNESMIQESISKLIENKTVLIIAHRMRTVDGVDQIVVLKDGVVFEQGKPQDLKQQNGIYKHMVEMQMQSHNWKYE